MNKDNFINLFKKKRKTVAYFNKNGETVALNKTEKQPHPTEVRLFDLYEVIDCVKIEASLSARNEACFYVRNAENSVEKCTVHNMQGIFFAVIADENGDTIDTDVLTEFLEMGILCDAESIDCGLCQCRDAITKITESLSGEYTDLELALVNKDLSHDVLDVHLANLIRICMLCVDTANTTSENRLLEIKLTRNDRMTEIIFSTAAKDFVDGDKRLALASFIAKAERGELHIKTEEGKLKMDFFFPAEPGSVPDFKYRDQFHLYAEYFAKIKAEIAMLHAKQNGQH